MRIFGRISELVSAVFRKDTYEITLRPNQSTTYTAARDVQLPAKDGNAVLVSSGDIVNADISASAAIAYSKLALSNSITNSDVSSTAAIAYSKLSLSGSIVNADISNTAAIADSKLATISTAGKVSNSATTATSSNTASAIVARDASGNFSAGTITATLSGNATNVSGTVAIANGGTGQTTQQAALNALAGTQSSGKYLRSDGTNTSLSSIQAADVPTLNQNTTGTAANVTGIVAPANGGTGQNFSAASGVIKASSGTFSAGSVSLTADVSGTLPVANGGTGITSLGSGVATFLGTPSSANLASAVTDETGSGSLVFGTGPTLSAPQVNSSLVIQQIATPSNPSAGFNKIYTKSDGLLYKLDSAGNEVLVGSGTGGGELNLVLNPDGDTALNGSRTNGVGDWVDSGTGTISSRTTTAADIPLSPLKTNAIKIVNANSGSGYTRMRMTLPPSLYNRKLKIAWEQEVSTSPAYASGDFKVELYSNASADYSGAYTRISLSTDASSVSAIPALTGKYQTSFDTSTAANLELRIVRVAGTNSSFLALNNVVVGPGIQPQGAVVGEWVSYTPTFEGLGTVTNASARYRRVGDSMQVAFSVTSGTNTAVLATVSLPSGFTINSTSIPANSIVGDLSASATPFDSSLLYFSGASSKLYFTSGTANYTAGANGTTWANATGFGGNFFVPIAEWAGSGTVQLAQNDVEYASNSSPTATTNDTTSFVYGPTGARIPTVALSTDITKRVRFQTPIQATDRLFIELNPSSSSQWIPIEYSPSVDSSGRGISIYVSGVGIGYVKVVNSTDIDVTFARYRTGTSNWSDITETVNWRVRKSSAGAAVGFGLYQPGVSAGLVSSSGLAGRADGNVVPSGYVGENYSFQIGSSVAVTTAWNNVLTMSNLPAGIWLLTGMAELNNAGSVSGFNLAISTFGGSTTTDHVRGVNQLPCSVPTNTGGSITIANYLVNITSATSYYLKAISVGGSSTLNCSLRAIRIA